MADRAQTLKADWQARLPDVSVHVTGGVIGGAAINEAALREFKKGEEVEAVLLRERLEETGDEFPLLR